MYNNFDYRISKIFKMAEEEMLELKHPYVGSEHLLLAILKNNDDFSKKLKEYNLEYKTFKDKLIEVVGSASKRSEIVLYTPLLKRVIDNAISDAIENNDGIVTSNHLFLSMLDEGEGIAIRLMLGLEIDLKRLYKEVSFCSSKNINKKSNLSIYEYGILLNEKVNLDEVVVGREKELELIVETLLRKNKNNPLLIGKAGVGKTAIVEELARRIEKKTIASELYNKNVVILEMGSLVAGTKYRGEFEERLNKIINEVTKDKNIILFIDEVHTIVGAGGAEGAIDASNILKPYLARGDIKCIGATTTNEYNKFIAKDKALTRRFQIINIEEPTTSETKYILNKIKDVYEKHHDIKISEDNINTILKFSNKYIRNRNNPDKCIDVLDSVCAKVKIQNNNSLKLAEYELKLNDLKEKKEKSIIKGNFDVAFKLRKEEANIIKKIDKLKVKNNSKITDEVILSVIEAKSNIPILENKVEIYKNIEDCLNSKIYGQKNAINKILGNIKRKLLKGSEKPLSLILVGPSGVGKTEVVKKISECISSKSNLIRLDMGEYNLETSVNKLIGVSAGYVGYDDEYIFESIKTNPYGVILLDEIEKANSKVLNLFLSILDEGFVTDSRGEKIYFNDTFIFMTSNIKLNNSVGFNNISEDDLNEILSKELIGRIDEVVHFNSLEKDSVKEYIKSIVEGISDKDINHIIKMSNYKTYGMRNVKRCINNLLEEKEELSLN